MPWSEFVGSSILIEKNLSIQVNFDNEILEIMAEAELLEILGFRLPNEIRSLAIQNKRIHSNLDALGEMVKEYTMLIERLDTPQV